MEQQMYKVQIDGEERSFPAGTTYLQIAGEYQERYPHDIVLVYVNGKLITSNGYHIKDNDIISVRQMGRFQYEGVLSETKKGRYYVTIRKYI